MGNLARKEFSLDCYHIVSSLTLYLQGFSNTFPDLPSLIEHHARVSDGLPCKLALSGSNVLCENEDYISMSSEDPDYMALSDYRNIYAELTERKLQAVSTDVNNDATVGNTPY